MVCLSARLVCQGLPVRQLRKLIAPGADQEKIPSPMCAWTESRNPVDLPPTIAHRRGFSYYEYTSLPAASRAVALGRRSVGRMHLSDAADDASTTYGNMLAKTSLCWCALVAMRSIDGQLEAVGARQTRYRLLARYARHLPCTCSICWLLNAWHTAKYMRAGNPPRPTEKAARWSRLDLQSAHHRPAMAFPTA